MQPETTLPNLLLVAWLLPLASFAVISIGYSVPQLLGLRVGYASSQYACHRAVGAIVVGFVLSASALFAVWLPEHPLAGGGHHAEAASHAADHNNPPPP